ncbi:MAG: RDD family protein [Chromatiales bacterium]|nr:RDD family protein [Chromatiales bacterium]
MNHNLDNAATPNLLRRLAAILYDLLLVAGLLMLATALVTIPVDLFLGQEAAGQLGDNLLFRLWLLAVPPAFFIGFWRLGGQTLGMHAWRMKMVSVTAERVSWGQATLHFFAALLSWLPFGLGFFWSLFEPEHRTWHDKLSGTRMVMLAKKS